MNDYLISSHPDELQIWLFKPAISLTDPASWLNHITGLIIELGEGFDGSHMAIRFGDDAWSAEPRGFVKLRARDETAYDGEITVFAFAPPLTEWEIVETGLCVGNMLGKPYDWLLTGQRGLKAALRLARWMGAPPVLDTIAGLLPVDLLAGQAIMCYESAARVIRATGRPWQPNLATFGPRDLWEAVGRGELVCRGRALNTTATGEGGNERC